MLLYLKFFCKTMLPHQMANYSKAQKVRLASLFLKLTSLQNYGFINLQNHGINDKNQFT
jgi:hypothetical protein